MLLEVTLLKAVHFRWLDQRLLHFAAALFLEHLSQLLPVVALVQCLFLQCQGRWALKAAHLQAPQCHRLYREPCPLQKLL